MARGCWAPAASAEAGGTGMCSALQGSALVRGEQLFAPPPSAPWRAGHCTPRSAAFRAPPSRYAARPRASSASRTGCSASPRSGGGGSGYRHPAPTMSQVSGVVPPPKKKPLPAYPHLFCGGLSSPGPPRWETVSPRAGSWGHRDGDTERNASPATAKRHQGPVPGLGAAAGPSCKRGSPSARRGALHISTGSTSWTGWAAPDHRCLAPPGCFLAPSRPFLRGSVAARPQRAAGADVPKSPRGSPRQPGSWPERQRPAGRG